MKLAATIVGLMAVALCIFQAYIQAAQIGKSAINNHQFAVVPVVDAQDGAQPETPPVHLADPDPGLAQAPQITGR